MSRRASIPPGWLAQYGRLIGAWARRAQNRQDAEDATHDAVLRYLESDCAAVEDPAAYLRRSVSNRAVSLHRAQAVRQTVALHELAEDLHPATESAEERWRAQRLAQDMLAALAELPADCQETFKLRRLEGLSNGEIALRLGVSRNMVERHMMRAMRHLQDRLQDDGGP